MRPIPAIDHSGVTGTAEAWRTDVAIGLGNFDDLATRPWAELARIEIFPGSMLGDPVIVMPVVWMPAGATRRLSFRTIDPGVVRSWTTDLPGAEGKRDESVRRALLALWLPRRTDTGIREYAPSSWLSRARLLLRAVNWQVAQRPSDDGCVWSHLTVQDLRALIINASTGERTRTDVYALLRWLADAGARGVLSDYPRLSPLDEVVDGEERTERSYQAAAPSPVQKAEERNWQHLPDAFVTELLWRALWLQRNLGPQLLECWSGLLRINDDASRLGQTSGNPAVSARRRRLIESIDWRDDEGKPITRLPFLINQQAGRGTERSDAWPPREGSTISQMVVVLQALNLSLVAFCTGARLGEIASATDASLVAGEAARFAARTFKLIDEYEGQARDWPLHPAAAQALELQLDLAQRCRPEDMDHIWVAAGRATGGVRGLPLHNLTEPLVKAAEHLGLSDLSGSDRPHAHRWRHTMARLVALTVVGAPQVLLDLFGHRDLEMTLRYMLSSPEIAQEAQTVAKEAAIALAEEAVADALADAAGGPAAATLKAGSTEFAMQRGEMTYGADDLRMLAETLTLNGKRWELVRPGVICTKAPSQAGPCTKGKGWPDPGGCRTNCEHRLELARARTQCDDTITALVAEIEAADADGSEMLAVNLRGQLLANLRRWDDLREAWIARSPLVAQVWKEG